MSAGKKLNAGIEMDKISLNQHVEIERYIVVGKYYPSEKTNYHTYIIGIPDENDIRCCFTIYANDSLAAEIEEYLSNKSSSLFPKTLPALSGTIKRSSSETEDAVREKVMPIEKNAFDDKYINVSILPTLDKRAYFDISFRTVFSGEYVANDIFGTMVILINTVLVGIITIVAKRKRDRIDKHIDGLDNNASQSSNG